MERNISVFNGDSLHRGGYVYNMVDRWSSRAATSRQTDELLRTLVDHFPPNVRITDIGCGDGALTLELVKLLTPLSIRGVDPAIGSIDVARRRPLSEVRAAISFEVGDIYNIQNLDKGCQEPSVAIVRGLLHHLDHPEAAISRLSQQFKWVLALEPNGFNPLMKVIERASTYHREHDEKSYWPPTLNRWFEHCGYAVVEQRFFCLVPYFCPTLVAKSSKTLEPLLEWIPVARELSCSTNLVLYRRTTPP